MVDFTGILAELNILDSLQRNTPSLSTNIVGTAISGATIDINGHLTGTDENGVFLLSAPDISVGQKCHIKAFTIGDGIWFESDFTPEFSPYLIYISLAPAGPHIQHTVLAYLTSFHQKRVESLIRLDQQFRSKV